MQTRLFGPAGAPGSAGLLASNTSGAAAAVLPATQIVTSTTETVILNPALNSASQALVLSIPANAPIDQVPFTVLASGVLSPGVSSTVTLKLYSGTSVTVGNDTLLGSSGAISAFAAKCPWYARARLIYDGVSGKLDGTIQFFVNHTLVAEVAVSNTITGVSTSGAGVGAPVANFVFSITWGTANAANSITVKDFAVYDCF